MTTAASSKSRTSASCAEEGGALPPAATIWQRFAKMLGIREDQAEDALKSERAAKLMLSRRAFFGVSGALAVGTAFAFAHAPLSPLDWRIGKTLDVTEFMFRQQAVGPFIVGESPMIRGTQTHSALIVLGVDHIRGIITLGSEVVPPRRPKQWRKVGALT